MKYHLAAALIFLLNSASAQIQCSCNSNQNLGEIVSCKPVVFKNSAKLYWQFNCDSSWLTFQNKNEKKIIFSSEFVELTERLGYIYVTEYKTTFLIQNNVISGCCDPPEFFLFDKEKGYIKSELGRLIFYSEDQDYPVVIYLDHSNYKSFDFSKIDYDYLTVLNVNRNKKSRIALPKGRIKKSLDITQDMFAEHIFETAIDGSVLTIRYRYQTQAKKDKWFNAEITVDLKKYCDLKK